jgi:hypothetical protein
LGMMNDECGMMNPGARNWFFTHHSSFITHH